MEQRLRKLEAYIQSKAEAVLITSDANRRYFSGFSGSAGCLLCSDKDRLLFTDSRYIEQAKAQAPEFTVIESGDFAASLPEFAARYRSVAFEAEALSYAEYEKCARALSARLIPTEGIDSLRAVKEQAEVEKIARAAQITDQALANLLVRLKVGTTEFEAAAELEYQMRLLGADGASFPTIIASGPNSALPHAQPGQRRLQTGDLVVIDCGAKWHGYCADLTRTVLVGQEPTARQLEVYRLVQAAQRAGLAAVRGGADCREVDQAARSVIAAAGLGHAFGHGLGHGVGLEIHEQPRLSPRGEGKLAKGMTVTVEPGVYLPPCGGVRIEDLVLVEDQGAKLLSGTDRELFCVG